MKKTYLFILTGILTLTIVSFTLPKENGIELRGTVVDAATGTPVENAYIFIAESQEEALTDKKGSFRLSTWQKLPVVLTIQHNRYRNKSERVQDASQLLIKLTKK